MEYRNRTLQTIINTFVYENKNSVASTGRALLAVNLCTVVEYRLNNYDECNGYNYEYVSQKLHNKNIYK